MGDVHGRVLRAFLGSPVVPFSPFFGSRFPYEATNPKGAIFVIWLLGYQVSVMLQLGTLNPMWVVLKITAPFLRVNDRGRLGMRTPKGTVF